ncbi:hypothetical protein AAFC00_002264 [Neodothiora populina]|uniref:RhoGAP-domain-containing protein n=1 Tax=Neodothiora populina TaxID=2781224 RepID=A0ABR3PGW4_9PEZI
MESELSPTGYPESPLDEDEIFLCKGCGEILEQGRAFELAGHRWHLTCFRCHSCGTLLDSDANLLLLGDGSLICNNCTYSCSSCGNKIEDLAILTGDQAFCATCFKCRNCKKKIENLRYARTSQGIFCMDCHESLMARRRKKAKQSRQSAAAAAASANHHNTMVLDKSLPALPPSAVPQSALQSSVETPPSDSYTDTPGEHSPRNNSRFLNTNRQDAPRRDVSPMSDDGRKETLTLPASTYKANRASLVSSVMSATASDNDDDQAGFLTMAFDPNPAPGPPPMSQRRMQHNDETQHTPRTRENLSPRDYFNKTPRTDHRDRLSIARPSSSRSVSTEREGVIPRPKSSSPHVAYQDKSRPSTRRDISEQSTPSPSTMASSTVPPTQASEKQERPRPPHLNSASYTLGGSSEPFKLQEVPQDRKVPRSSPRVGNRSDTTLEILSQTRYQPPEESNVSSSPASLDTPSSSFNPFDDPKLREATSGPSSATRLPAREDSLPPAAKKEREAESTSRITSPNGTPSTSLDARHQRNESASSSQYVDAPAEVPAEASRSNNQPSLDSPLKSGSIDGPTAPPRAASRPSAPSKSVGNNDDFIAPRHPPPPPSAASTDRPRNESVSTSHSDIDRSAYTATSPPPPSWRGHLPKHSAGGDFSMEEEMARILRGENKDKKREDGDGTSVLRRVSNAVKHGRSFSDRSVPIHHKTPTLGSIEISSPINLGSPASSGGMRDEITSLRAQLRRSQQKIAELEAEKIGLEEQVTTSADIKQVNTELREKRSTMAFLDTQREMVVRELEVMTDHLSKAKDTNRPLDIEALKSDVLQDFARSLQKLKDSIGAQVEDLVHKRNELTDDIGSLIQVKDKGLQEFENLSSKNHQLAELNNQLVTSIQEMYRANAGRLQNAPGFERSPLTNGLGIYTAAGKADIADFHSLKAGSLQESSSLQNLLPEGADAEPATILTAPKVVDIRKAQPKKFWKKGSSGIGKSVTKGLKGAFAGGSDRMPINTGSYDLNGMPYSQMQAGPGAVMGDSALNAKQDGKGGFGFFSSGQKNGLKPGTTGSNLKNSSSTNLPSEAASVLFGSDLQDRCDYEKRVIPAIVTRCIEEVELRGMDMEGIYRKSGGSGQVKTIQQGFDKDGNYDISDPDLDIHAVTSALKQYFRKLPNPLITYEAYDGVLHAAQITDKEKQATTMRAAMDALPQAHRVVLEFLVQHLCRVVKMESENLMTPLNLSVVFAPTIMRPLSIEREMSDMQAQRMAVQALLEHADTVFEAIE